MGFIYKITNTINGKVYIGQTIRNVERRFYEHKYTAENVDSHNSNYPLYSAMRKYGIENFNFEIIEECDDSLIDKKEIEYIKQYNSYVGFENSNGYNATLGGDKGFKIERQQIYDLWEEGLCVKDIELKTSINRNTISDILVSYYGKNIKEEIKLRGIKKNSEATSFTIKQYTVDGILVETFPSIHKAFLKTGIFNISRASTEGQKAGGYYWVSINSPFTIEELLAKPKGDELKNKSVTQYTLDGIFVSTYPSLKEATKTVKVSHIGDVCNGKRKSAGGFIWKWTKDI